MTEFKFGDVVIEHKNGHERKMVVTGKAFRDCTGLVVLAVYKGGTAANIVNVKNLTLVSRHGQGQRLEPVSRKKLRHGDEVWVRAIAKDDGTSEVAIRYQEDGEGDWSLARLVPADAEVSEGDKEAWKLAVLGAMAVQAERKRGEAQERLATMDNLIGLIKGFKAEIEED